MLTAISKYQDTVLNLWKREHASSSEGFQRWPLLSAPPVCDRVEVITLGLNPSYVLDELEAHWHAVRNDNPDMPTWSREVLSWDGNQPEELRDRYREIVKQLDKHSRDAYGVYYAPIEQLVSAAGKRHAWYHMDIFPLRETVAKQLTVHVPVPMTHEEREKLAGANSNSRQAQKFKWNSIFDELFDASIDLVRDLEPKVVVVLNSYVSRMLHYKLPLEIQANGHRYRSKKLPKIVFLLGSQLSGGATSTYGKERLLADLRDVVRGKAGLDGGSEALANEVG